VNDLLRVSLSAGYAGRPDVLKALAILGLLGMRGGTVRGQVLFEGADLLLLPERRLREIRGRRIALVPQSPLASLNPALKIASQFKEAWKAHQPSDGDRWRREAFEALELASLTGVPAILDC
jgi:ABC-type glutathione transport system ATPase component